MAPAQADENSADFHDGSEHRNLTLPPGSALSVTSADELSPVSSANLDGQTVESSSVTSNGPSPPQTPNNVTKVEMISSSKRRAGDDHDTAQKGSTEKKRKMTITDQSSLSQKTPTRSSGKASNQKSLDINGGGESTSWSGISNKKTSPQKPNQIESAEPHKPKREPSSYGALADGSKFKDGTKNGSKARATSKPKRRTGIAIRTKSKSRLESDQHSSAKAKPSAIPCSWEDDEESDNDGMPETKGKSHHHA